MSPDRSLNRTLGFALGAVYLLVGAAGFLVTGGLDFLARDGKALIIFDVNPLHNVVHLLVGALLVAGAARGVAAAKSVNGLVGAVYLLVGVLGVFLVDTDADILGLNVPDNLLHFGSAALLLAVALGTDRMATVGRRP
jgi:Domain of unknown function (DUF4383)